MLKGETDTGEVAMIRGHVLKWRKRRRGMLLDSPQKGI
jgi:hypothetical protein